MIRQRLQEMEEPEEVDSIIKERKQCRFLDSSQLELEKYIFGDNYYKYLMKFINVPRFNLEEERQFLLQPDILKDFTEQIADFASFKFITFNDFINALPDMTFERLSNYNINDYRLKTMYYFDCMGLDIFTSCITADYKLLGEKTFSKFKEALEPKMAEKFKEAIRQTNLHIGN